MGTGTSMLLIRHGHVQIPFDAEGRHLIYGPEQPLSDTGKEQMQLLGQTLDRSFTPTIIYTSPILRAVQSANILKDSLSGSIPVVPLDGIRSAETIQWDHQPIEWLIESGGNLFSPNPYRMDIAGESITDAYKRTIGEIKRIRELHSHESVALVTHGEIIGLAEHYLLTGDEEKPFMKEPIEKGEALFFQFDPEGHLQEKRTIKPEGYGPNPERRG